VDSQHGRFEKTDQRGKHQGEVDISGILYEEKKDSSGQHDLKTR
jgi:hypothetical protein